MVLEDTVERIYHQDVFAELKLGLYLIRGENVVLLGEIVRLMSDIPYAIVVFLVSLIISFYPCSVHRISIKKTTSRFDKSTGAPSSHTISKT